MFLDAMPEGFRYPSPEDDGDTRILAHINRKGWHNLAVPPAQGEPGFSFSLGHFLNHDHPEIIVLGLKDELASRLLDAAAVRIRDMGERLLSHREYPDFLPGLNVVFLPVAFPHYRHYLGFANWFYESLPVPYPALQLVWPDGRGVFPWQPGYDRRFQRLQPLLGAAPAAIRLQ
jgi:hypothetical protein